MNWNEIKEYLFPSICWVCGQERANQLDHALFSGSQRHSNRQTAEWRGFLDNIFNAQPACFDCNVHSRTADTYEAKQQHVRRMLAMDADGFLDWLNSAPFRGPRFDEIERMTHV